MHYFRPRKIHTICIYSLCDFRHTELRSTTSLGQPSLGLALRATLRVAVDANSVYLTGSKIMHLLRFRGGIGDHGPTRPEIPDFV